MNTLVEVEKAVQKLEAKELAEFRDWFARYDGEMWDRQFEEDVADGRLDALAEEALKEDRAGYTSEL